MGQCISSKQLDSTPFQIRYHAVVGALPGITANPSTGILFLFYFFAVSLHGGTKNIRTIPPNAFRVKKKQKKKHMIADWLDTRNTTRAVFLLQDDGLR